MPDYTVQNILSIISNKYDKKLTRARINQLIDSECTVDRDYKYLNSRLILVNGNGLRKIIKKIKLS